VALTRRKSSIGRLFSPTQRFLQEEVGIAPTRLQAVGMSEFHSVVIDKTLVGQSQNRRIDIALLPDIRELPSATESNIKE
jgi:hypothetical protein